MSMLTTTLKPPLPIAVKQGDTWIWSFTDSLFQSEGLPELEDLGFDYASDPSILEHDCLLIVDGPDDTVAVHLTALRDNADVAGLETRLRQNCTECQIEFLALLPA
jgi:hypothetical protein